MVDGWSPQEPTLRELVSLCLARCRACPHCTHASLIVSPTLVRAAFEPGALVLPSVRIVPASDLPKALGSTLTFAALLACCQGRLYLLASSA